MECVVFDEGKKAQTSEIKSDLFSLSRAMLFGFWERPGVLPNRQLIILIWSVINLVYNRLIKVTRKLIGTWISRTLLWMAQRNDTAKQKFRRNY